MNLTKDKICNLYYAIEKIEEDFESIYKLKNLKAQRIKDNIKYIKQITKELGQQIGD